MTETETPNPETSTESPRISAVLAVREPDGMVTIQPGERITWEALTEALEELRARAPDANITVDDGKATIDWPEPYGSRLVLGAARRILAGRKEARITERAAMMPRLAADPGIELRAIAEAAPEPLEVTIERMPKPIDDPFGPRNRAERRKAAAEARRSRKRKRR